MKQRPRIYYSDTQKALMWDRWQNAKRFRAVLFPVTRNGGRRRYRASKADQAACKGLNSN
jgi:hypothetical protein